MSLELSVYVLCLKKGRDKVTVSPSFFNTCFKCKCRGWSGVAVVLCKHSVLGHPTNLDYVLIRLCLN